MEPLNREIIEWVCPSGVDAASVLKDWSFCYSERWPTFDGIQPMQGGLPPPTDATSTLTQSGLRRSLNSFLRRWEREKKSEQAFEFYHLSLPEWLSRPPPSGSQFKVDPEPGHYALAQVGIDKLQTQNGYFVRHLATHINEGLCSGIDIFVSRPGYTVGDSIGISKGRMADLLTELRDSAGVSERLEGLARFLTTFFPHLSEQVDALEIAGLVQTLSGLLRNQNLTPSCLEEVREALDTASEYSFADLPSTSLPARLLPYLASMLTDNSDEAKQFAAHALAELAEDEPEMQRDIAATPGALSGLLFNLDSESTKVRNGAVNALRTLSDDRQTQKIITAPQYLSVLENLLKDTAAEKSLAAAQVLEALAVGTKSEARQDFLKYKSLAIRQLAAQAAQGHEPSAALIASDPDPVVFQSALDTLIPRSTASISSLNVLRERISQYPGAVGDVLNSKEKLTRMAAMMKVSWAGRPKAVGLLRDLTSSGRFDPARATVASPNLVPTLIGLLPSPDEHGATDGAEEDWDNAWDGVQPLNPKKEPIVFNDVRKVVWGLTAQILEKLSDSNAHVQTVILQSHAALLGLVELVGASPGPGDEGLVGSEAAGRLLMQLTQGGVENRRVIAATPDVLPTLAQVLSSPKFAEQNKYIAAKVLRAISSGRTESKVQFRNRHGNPHGGLPDLVTLMRSESPGVRAQAAEAFAYLAATGSTTQTTLGHGSGVLAVLVRLLEPAEEQLNRGKKGHRPRMSSGDDSGWGREPDEIASVQESASQALASLSATAATNQRAIVDADAVPRLIGLLSGTAPARVRVAAARALEAMVRRNLRVQQMVIRAGVLPPLIESLKAESPLVRARAASALGAIARGSTNHQRLVADTFPAIPNLLAILAIPKDTSPEGTPIQGSPVLLSHNPGQTLLPDSPPPGLAHEMARQDAQLQAISALISIIHRNLYTQDKVADAGGVLALAHLLQSDDTSDDAKEKAVEALSYLTGGVTWINSKAYEDMGDNDLTLVLSQAHSSAVASNNNGMSVATNNILQRINRRWALWLPQCRNVHSCMQPFLHRGLIILSSCYD